MKNHALIFFALFLEGCGGHLTSISQVVLRLAKITKFEARSQGPLFKSREAQRPNTSKINKQNQIEKKRGKLEGQIKERRRQTVLANIIGWSCQRHALALILGNNHRRTNLL